MVNLVSGLKPLKNGDLNDGMGARKWVDNWRHNFFTFAHWPYLQMWWQGYSTVHQGLPLPHPFPMPSTDICTHIITYEWGVHKLGHCPQMYLRELSPPFHQNVFALLKQTIQFLHSWINGLNQCFFPVSVLQLQLKQWPSTWLKVLL